MPVKPFILLVMMLVTASVFAAEKPSLRFTPPGGPLVNDREIKIRTAADAAAKRAKIIKFIWGRPGMPLDKLPAAVERGVVKPDNLQNLERVDTLHIAMDAGVKGLAHLFLPRLKKNSRVAIIHLGHTDGCTFNDNVPGEPDIGMRRTISALLDEGFAVIGVYMPQITPEDCRWEHDRLFQLKTTGSPLKFFLEPTLVSLNYVRKKLPQYTDVSMIGLSGGGWTTTLYAAVDPRVLVSIPVAGSLPLYLCHEGYGHDIEQRLDSFYRLAGYPDLYILGAYGVGRKQIQILNRQDDCCFGEKQHDRRLSGMPFEPSVRDYEQRVQKVLATPGFGSFRVIIDEKADRHKISADALRRVIIPELRSRTAPPVRANR
jgi:hypothetical protein